MNLLTGETDAHPDLIRVRVFELDCDKTNKMICAPIEDSDQPRHPSSLVCLKLDIHKAHSRSDCADAQADLSLCWMHISFFWFCPAQAH